MIPRKKPLPRKARWKHRRAHGPAKRRGPRGSPRRVADRLCGEIVRSRGKCEACGGSSVLQWAHGFSRRYLNVRWDLENGFCLCRACHYRYTLRPLEWDAWMRAKLGIDRFEQLRARALIGGKPDVAALVLFLERERARVG